jgi:hypothetical protein
LLEESMVGKRARATIWQDETVVDAHLFLFQLSLYPSINLLLAFNIEIIK